MTYSLTPSEVLDIERAASKYVHRVLSDNHHARDAADEFNSALESHALMSAADPSLTFDEIRAIAERLRRRAEFLEAVATERDPQAGASRRTLAVAVRAFLNLDAEGNA